MFALKVEHFMSPKAGDALFLFPKLVQDKEKYTDFR